MKYDPKIHHRRSIRLPTWDYSWVWWYYVTICTQDKACVLGEIKNDNVNLSEIGRTVHEHWLDVPKHFPTVELDDFVIMPNHLHGIIILNEEGRGLINQTPTKNDHEWQLMKNPNVTLGKVIRHFKARVSKLIHDAGFTSFKWQRGFYDHIIRNDTDLTRIRTYIANNPLQWVIDEENPEPAS